MKRIEGYCDHCDAPLRWRRKEYLCRTCKIEVCLPCHRGRQCPRTREPTTRGYDPLLRVSTTLSAKDIAQARIAARKQRVRLSKWIRRAVKAALEDR